MVDIEIPQDEADAFIQMPKYRVNDDTWHFPGRGRSINIPLQSEDKRNNFLLDVWRGRLELNKNYVPEPGAPDDNSGQIGLIIQTTQKS